MEPLGGGWRASVHHHRPKFVAPRLDRLLAVRGDRLLDAYSREAERRKAAGRFDLPAAIAFSLLLHGALLLIPLSSRASSDAASTSERRMVLLSLGSARREAETRLADAALEPEAAVEPVPAASVAATEAPSPAAVEKTEPAPATERAAVDPAVDAVDGAAPEASAGAEVAADAERSAPSVEAVAPQSILAAARTEPEPIAAKAAPAPTLRPAAAAAAILSRPKSSNAGAGIAPAAVAAAQSAYVASAAGRTTAAAEPPNAIHDAPTLVIASGFFSPAASPRADEVRADILASPGVYAPPDSDRPAGAPIQDEATEFQTASAGRTARIASRAPGGIQPSGIGRVSSDSGAGDQPAERSDRTFSPAIGKYSLLGAIAPTIAIRSGAAGSNDAPVSGLSASPADGGRIPDTMAAPAIAEPAAATAAAEAEGPPKKAEAPNAAPEPAVEASSFLPQSAPAPDPAASFAVGGQRAEPDAPPPPPLASQPLPPSAPTPELKEPEIPAPEPPAAKEAPAFPSPREVLDLLSSLVAERKAYPEAAKRRKAQGSVGISLKVAPDGTLASAAIQKKSGSAILDRAALDLVKGLFPIALRPGEPMEIALSIEYRLVP